MFGFYFLLLLFFSYATGPNLIFIVFVKNWNVEKLQSHTREFTLMSTRGSHSTNSSRENLFRTKEVRGFSPATGSGAGLAPKRKDRLIFEVGDLIKMLSDPRTPEEEAGKVKACGLADVPEGKVPPVTEFHVLDLVLV